MALFTLILLGWLVGIASALFVVVWMVRKETPEEQGRPERWEKKDSDKSTGPIDLADMRERMHALYRQYEVDGGLVDDPHPLSDDDDEDADDD